MVSVREAEQCKAHLDKALFIIFSFFVFMGKLELMHSPVFQLMGVPRPHLCGAETEAGAREHLRALNCRDWVNGVKTQILGKKTTKKTQQSYTEARVL